MATVLGVVAIVAVTWGLTPSPLASLPATPSLPADLDDYVAASESSAHERFPLIPETGKRIRWQTPGEKTEWAVVYVHGFSATRQEIAPATEMIADRLGANLFETRLTGHGRAHGVMLETTADDWLADAAEAIAIGHRIGNRVVLMGTSTGATIVLAMAEHPLMQQVDSIVLISPNFAPFDPNSRWLTGPAGPLIARLLVGDTRSFEPLNAEQERYWSTTYPTASIVEVMRVVDRVNSVASRNFQQDMLMLVSPDDRVVSVQAAIEGFSKITARSKTTIEFTSSTDPSSHVLGGRIVSPDSTDELVDVIVDYVMR